MRDEPLKVSASDTIPPMLLTSVCRAISGGQASQADGTRLWGRYAFMELLGIWALFEHSVLAP